MDFSSKHETNIWIFSIIVYISICMAFPLFPWFCGYSKNQVLLTVKTVNHTNPISWCIYAWCTYDCIRMGWENALLKVFVKWVYIWNKNLTSIVKLVILEWTPLLHYHNTIIRRNLNVTILSTLSPFTLIPLLQKETEFLMKWMSF